MRLRALRVVIGATVAIVVACRSGYFGTRATYDAPKSRFRMIVDAVGNVAADGQVDACCLNVHVCPRDAPATRELRITLSPPTRPPRTAVVEDGPSTTRLSWDEKDADASFAAALKSAGYATDVAEVEEAVRVIDGIGHGPKATPMPGQTHALTVVTVDFNKSRGSSRCAP